MYRNFTETTLHLIAFWQIAKKFNGYLQTPFSSTFWQSITKLLNEELIPEYLPSGHHVAAIEEHLIYAENSIKRGAHTTECQHSLCVPE